MMERLTKRVGVGEAINNGDFDICAPFIKSGYCKTGMQGGFPRKWERHCNDTCALGLLIDRLAAYEDTGLTPEQIRNAQETLRCFDNIGIKRGNEIVTAEEKGRLVVIPCNVGETVWLIDERFCGRGRERWPLIRCRVNEFAMSGESAFAILDGAESWYSVRRFKAVSVLAFGKTVFLTREEAEAVLKGDGK